MNNAYTMEDKPVTKKVGSAVRLCKALDSGGLRLADTAPAMTRFGKR